MGVWRPHLLRYDLAAVSTDQIASEALEGSNGNGYKSNGNGNGNGRAAYANGASLLETANGNGAIDVLSSAEDLPGVNGFMDPCEAGQLDTCAVERIAAAEQRAAEAAAAAATASQVAVAAAAAAAAVTEQELTAAAAAAAAAGGEGQRAAPAAEALPQTAAGTPYVSPGGRWSQFKSYSVFQRTFDIWSFALNFFWRLWLVNQKFTYGKEGMTPPRVSQRRAELHLTSRSSSDPGDAFFLQACWLREGLVKLGPTFIKIGQQFSTRVDVLSPEFIKELEKLQDNVPAFDSASAIAIVESGLGRPISQLYEEFDPVPIAAASLGQVHCAKVNGQRVVVKVQRPGLKELFDIDLKNVRVLAQWLQKVDPKSDGAARDWVAIYDECSRILYQEIDYVLEGQNADRFRQNFANTDWVKVPRVLWDYTTSQVLTMEYTPGVKINRIEELDRLGVDRKRLARLSVESYLQQILNHGFFHADPHPGNIAVDAEGGGRLIYYDFGMMGSIPSGIRGGLMELFYGVYEKDADRCLDALVAMGVLVPGGDRVAVRRTAEFFLKSFQDRLEEQKRERQRSKEYEKTFKAQTVTKDDMKARRKQILANIGEDLLVAAADKPFRFPATFTFVVRSFTVLDGIGKGLDPRFDISEIAAPYARELLLEGQPQYAALQKEFQKRLGLQNRAVKNLFKGPNYIEDVATTVTKLERGDLKLRVRALEAERALNRVQGMQKALLAAIAASMLVNMGTVLRLSALSAASTASFAGAAFFGFLTLINVIKVQSLEKKELQLTGAA
ncbi:hypothetical protein N2152v2_000069 [Parachlorella kessleri]